MNKITISAKNLEMALMKAATELAISRAEVAHQISEHNQGFLGLGKKITIQAWPRKASPKSPDGEHSSPRPKPKSPPKSKDMSPELMQEVVGGLKELLSNIIKLGFGIQCEITTSEEMSLEGKRVIFEVDSAEFAQILTKEVLLADAIEHLLRKQPRHIKRELPFKIFVDAQSSRRQREQKILDHAKQVSEEVVKSGESIVLDYESSYDRKIIHLALNKDDRVFNKSIGYGARKKLMISLSDRQ